MKTRKYLWFIPAILLVFVLVLLGVNEKCNEKVMLTAYTFAHEEVPEAFEGYKILMISDLHEAPFAEQIIEHIHTQNPDMVVITGDMVQLPGTSLDETLKIAEGVKDIPIYAVTGNHDTQCGAYDAIMEALDGAGIIPLDNDSVCIERGEDSFLLLGLKDPENDVVSEKKYANMRKQIASEFPDGPCLSILLNHRADMYPEIKDTGVDLILSGHLHGGIIRLPFVGGLVGKNPEDSWFPEYEYGVVKEGDSATMIVSGGCDKNPQKKRYFNPPEVVLITLEGAERT